MYHVLHEELARAHERARRRTEPPQGVRRGARSINEEVRIRNQRQQ